MPHIHVSQAAGAEFFTTPGVGAVVMLNLLSFHEIADYSEAPGLAPESPISGREAYERYIAHTMPFLSEAGSTVLYEGDAGAFLIGPDDEHWHKALLIQHQSKEAFLKFAQNKGYLAGAGHRTAALADSRLLPLTTANRS